MRNVVIVIELIALLGCSSAYYGTMEKLGYHRRDLMVNRVESARDAQDDAKEEFESAYGGVHKRGRRFYQFNGT
jgi:hypothetical protein